jgi:hypothetical protein
MTDTSKDSVIHVVSAVVDTEKAHFYLTDGSIYTMLQTDKRLADILPDVIRLNSIGQVAVIYLDHKKTNTFAEAEKNTNGFVKFFKVAKQKLASWLAPPPEPVTPVVEAGGTVTEAQKQAVQAVSAVQVARAKKQAPDLAKEQREAAVADVIRPKTEDLQPHMTPVRADTTFDAKNETIVAVVDNEVIADMQQLEEMLKNMNQTKQTKGFVAFMDRISKVIKNRRHSVEDLIRFLERADLPLANDGSVIAYKLLNQKHGKEGYFVDQECSAGLHIARRAYLGNFGGNICVLCKIAPEDFMAVPHQDPNKVRVAAYEILDVIPGKTKDKLKYNKPGTDDPAFLRQLYKAINGLYPPPVEEVLIQAERGGNLKITPLESRQTYVRTPVVTKTELDVNRAFDDPQSATAVVTSPESVHEKLSEATDIAQEDLEAAAEFHDKVVANGGTNEGMGTMMPTPTPPDPEVANGGGALSTEPEPKEDTLHIPVKGTFRERAQKLWDAYVAAKHTSTQVEAAKALMALKKEAKKGWDKLNMTPSMVKAIEATLAAKPASKPEPLPVTTTKASETTNKLSDKLGGKKVAVPPAPTENMNKVQMTRYLFDKWNNDNTKANADALLAHKKSAKKGWSVLGLTEKEIETIKLFLGEGK